ncbi:MAG: VOC family protein [Acetobacteraceae bacterium]|nr:VOC family protein [Acetobacteraceae bacterium]
MPRVSGVLETSLYVVDLDRAQAFYARVFGFETFVDDGRMCAMGVPGSQVLLLFRRGSTDAPAPTPGGVIPPHYGEGALHVCFAIPFGELAAWERHLRAENIAIESRISWPRGGTSLYFRDPDGHSVEVATPGLWPNA